MSALGFQSATVSYLIFDQWMLGNHGKLQDKFDKGTTLA